jgi:Ca2+-binding RTX toxin-like protein
MVKTVNSSGLVGSTSPEIIQGASYELQPAPLTGVLVFMSIDPPPAIDPLSTQVPIITLSAFNSGNAVLPDVPIPSDQTGNTAYYIAKFTEGVTGVTNQSFIVSQNGAFTQSQEVKPLWLNGSTWSEARPPTSSSDASYYLVKVNPPLDPVSNPIGVTLKSAPPEIVSVQEMNAAPPGSEMSGNFIGNQPAHMTTQGSTVSWLKVTLDESANQFLLEARVNPSSVPQLEYTIAADEGWPGYNQTVSPSYAVQGSNPNVVYLGFNSGTTAPYDAPASIAFKTNTSNIMDRDGNILGSSEDGPAPVYLDAAGELAFSPIWEGDTTTITNASVFGYANGANVMFNPDGTKTYSEAYDPLLPSYFTDGQPSKDVMGAPKYDAFGDRIGLDSIDLSGISGGPMIINADLGRASVYVGESVLDLDVSDYDRYILNDRASNSDDFGNEFYGTEDSEYVVVGSGGDNYLVAGNLNIPTDISADVKVKNYEFNSVGIVRETDIVDYSQLDMGITVDLGESASDEVIVLYSDGTDLDMIVGFEGVVGSGGDDDISGSNVGNVLVGGAGHDELRGYTGEVDSLYDPAEADYGTKGTTNYKEAQFLVDSSDILYGGAGDDKLYGGAGRDILVDLGKAEMLGSDKTGFSGDGKVGLRDSANKLIAENDVFYVRGDGVGAEKATINNFHLSKDGTGLAGRSNSANDALLFSIDTTKLFGANAPMMTNNMSDEALYNYVYSRLNFEKITNIVNDDIELVVNFKFDNFSPEVRVGSTIIADVGSMLDGDKNRVEVVELKWLAKDGTLDRFNPKIEMDLTDFVQTDEFGSSMDIAIALELQQAGTVRGTNNYGVMAAKLSDNGLDERVYNPGDKDDRILGTTNDDSYEYIVQQFTPTPSAPITPPGETPTPPAVITNQVGKDAIFDTGGNDVLMFESAKIEDLTFSAVKVGRESKANSLKVLHKQTEALDDGTVKNEGEVIWQGHYKEGGRQAAEILKIKDQEFDIAQAVYEYNSKGYAKGGPEITATSARDVIMVGQGAGDKFVFDFTPAPVSTGSQTARIAGFGSNDKIDISKYGVVEDSLVTHNTNGGMDSTVRLEFATGFVLNLSFQGSVTDYDLNFALGTALLT